MQRRGKRSEMLRRRYSVRIETAPRIRIRWAVPAGIQIAKCGGISQELSPLHTSITPRIAWIT
jgi:hypothetical protein